ncbi:MAG: hypothetical protein QOH51_1123 [Acidobacteriota bacterium]|jgi:hypothetical protein|nr:hypothetical protein [Acidobacteriota bacterium]
MAATKAKSKTAAPIKPKTASKKTKPVSSRSAKAADTKKVKAAPAKSGAKAAASKAVVKKSKPLKGATAKDVLDFEEFPAGSVSRRDVTLCLACIYRLFTNQLGLAPRTAYNEIRRYAPTVEELSAREPQRPFFKPSEEKNPHCPYCDAPKRWHALVTVHRFEGGKASDTARRALARRLTTKDEQFQIHEEKRTSRQVFFEWLERLGQGFDFEDDSAWLLGAAREYLQRREPKADWAEAFRGVRQVRRSQRLDTGWERDGARLFLAPPLYNDVLLVQYLVSRSHRHGGRTFEGRLTLPELVRRMRYGGQLEARGITDRDQFDVLEQLVEHLTGGDDPARLHFIIDRRDLLDKAKLVARG